MLKIGITGQIGFIGTHLFNTLGLFPQKYNRIPFEDQFFDDETLLESFVKQCDVIVHLAAMNRHNDPYTIYQTNLKLVNQLITACEKTNSFPHILFSSSSQEERDNLYGKSKKEGRKLLENWANRSNASFSGFVIPNVFGPFGNPYYNSVIATFCYQVTHNETPKIEIDAEIKLIYVAQLVKIFIERIDFFQSAKSPIVDEIKVNHTKEIKVSEILKLINSYKQNYFTRGEIPSLNDEFEKNLFNTFLTYIDHSSFFPFHLKLHTDERGSFVETIKLNSGGQVSFSTTKQGITRGNHFHTRKAERFAVIKGKAKIELRRIGTENVNTFYLDGDQPSFVDMPIWFTHNITNTGSEDLFTFFWINEQYDADDSDTYYEKV